MTPFSVNTALAMISDDTLRRTTQSIIYELNETMRAMGYKYGVRDDSRLAFNWASGTVSCNLVDITEELSFIQWLSDTTDYRVVSEKALRHIANGLKLMYTDVSWTDIWAILRIYGPDIVRYVVLEMQHPAGVPTLAGFTMERESLPCLHVGVREIDVGAQLPEPNSH